MTDCCVYAAAVQPTADGSFSASLAAPPVSLHSADYDTAPPQKCQKIGNHVQRLLEKSVFNEDACQELYQELEARQYSTEGWLPRKEKPRVSRCPGGSEDT